MPRKVKSKVKQDYLSQLPVELKNQVCSYLGGKDLVNLLQINRTWKNLLDRPETWRALYLKEAVDVKRLYLTQVLRRCYECRVRGATHPTFVPSQRVCGYCYEKLRTITASYIRKLYNLPKREILKLPGPICPPNHKRDKLYSLLAVQEATQRRLGGEGWTAFQNDFKKRIDSCQWASYWHFRRRTCSCNKEYYIPD